MSQQERVRDRIRELESKLTELKHNEFGIYFIELLKAEYQREVSRLVEAEDPVTRGKAQQIGRYLKILGVPLLIFE
jgi:hypothetical protein